jgi:hypothetical protein
MIRNLNLYSPTSSLGLAIVLSAGCTHLPTSRTELPSQTTQGSMRPASETLVQSVQNHEAAEGGVRGALQSNPQELEGVAQ